MRIRDRYIYESVFNSLIKVVLPEEKKHFDLEDEDEEMIQYCFPELNSITDMKKAVGIEWIEIDWEYRNGIAWSKFGFAFSADIEHGLVMAFEGDTFLHYGGIGGYTHEKIMTKEEHNSYWEKWKEPYLIKFYEPHPKYGLLKPWQEDSNNSYPTNILREGRKAVSYTHLTLPTICSV